ncbi:MAG: MBL fold metallo-hydrolase [Desulfobacterales bacterium]|jgi:L-ascorbate metabolism protein UlaG (beta-lactamase superfamily)|nr:MBL fold metallo-hydrolase [Desulfobacterales bacterium]
MNRRRFIDTLLNIAKAAIAASVLPPGVSAALADDAPGSRPHYRPLDGRNLRDIARFRQHHGDGRFINPFSFDRSGRLLKVLSWKLFHRNRFRDELDHQPITPVSVDWEPLRADKGLSLTYLKHAGLMVNDGGHRLLIDPVFAEIFWFMRDFSPLTFDVSAMPSVDQVLLTHGHFDHLDVPSLSALPQRTHVLSPLGYGRMLAEIGRHHRTELDWYQSLHGSGREITLLPCNHWTMRNPVAGPNLALWGSYLIRTAAGPTIYVSGDTAYFDGFEQIGREYDIDLAVINLGAYEPRWFMAQSHIGPEETVRAFRELGAKRLAIVHWGTFKLGDEPVHFPPRHIRAAMQQEGLQDRLVDWKHGDTLFF